MSEPQTRITAEQLQNLKAQYPAVRVIKFDDLDVVMRPPTAAEAEALEWKRIQAMRSDGQGSDKGRAEILACVVFPEPVHDPKAAGTSMEYRPAELLKEYLADFPRALEPLRKHFRELGGQAEPSPGPAAPDDLKTKYRRRALTVRIGGMTLAGRCISEGEYNDEDDKADREHGGAFHPQRMAALARSCLTQRLGDDGVTWLPMTDADWSRVPYAAQQVGYHLLKRAEGQVLAVEGK